MGEPQRQPYPKDWIAHKIRVIDAIIAGDQVTDKDYVDALFALVSGALVYQGTWDASTNTPTLADGTGTTGHFYAVTVSGSQDLGSGSITFTAGDRVIHNGTIWQKWDTNDVITSVFGRTGDVVAVSGDYAHSEIGSVTADQHHDKSHAHDGADGSGTVAHGDTTGQGADDHHLEDTQARQPKIYQTSYAKGSNSAPNDGSLSKPFKTGDKAIAIGGDRAIIVTDNSIDFAAEVITIPPGQSISIFGVGYNDPAIFGTTAIKLNQGSHVNLYNMEIIDIAQLGGVTDATARLHNCRLFDATTSTSINFELYGARLESSALVKMATAKTVIGLATDLSGVIVVFGNGTQGIDMQDSTLDSLCNPTTDQEAVNRRYMVAEYLTGGRQWWSVTEQKNTPEATPTIFEAFLVGDTPTGAWVGHANEIAIAEEITPTVDWVYITDQTKIGLVLNQSDGKFYKWSGSAWVDADLQSGSDVDAKITTHAGLPDAHHTEDHAARHKDGGADELDVSELAGALGSVGEVPETDGAAVTWVEPDGRYDPKSHGISDNTKHSGSLVNDNITLGDANGLVKDSGVAISSIVGGLNYQGTWDASTNTPTLADGTGTKGHYYRVSVAGSQDLGSGSITFAVEDYVAHNGSIWQKIDHTDQVTSVFTRQGAVVAAASDYDASQVDNDSGVSGTFVDDALNTLDAETIYRGTSFPSTPSDGDMFNRTDLDMVFRYDGGRTKWLSEHSEVFVCGRGTVNPGVDVYGIVSGAGMSSTNGIRMQRNGTIVAVTVQNANSATRNIDFRVNNSLVNRVQLALAAAVGGKDVAADQDFSADDLIQVVALIAAANPMADMIATFEVKWRA